MGCGLAEPGGTSSFLRHPDDTSLAPESFSSNRKSVMPDADGQRARVDMGHSRVLLKDIALLWTGDDERVQPACSIFVDNGIIQWVGHHSSIPSSLLNTDHTVEDMSNRLVTPGLVNTHHHMYQSLTKCMARNSQLFEWLQTLYPLWSHLSSDMVYKSAKFAIGELLLSGCTLTSDMLYLFPNDVKLEDTICAAQELGIRFMPCRGAVSIGESDGGLPPDSLVEDENAVLQDMKRVIELYHDSHDGAMIRIALAPCSPFSVSENLMTESAKLARQYHNVMLHTHLAENKSDMEYMDSTIGRSVAEFLEGCGWNQNDCWFAHCVKISDDDDVDEFPSSLQYLADNGCGVAHCPVSNCRLASGVAPVRQMLDRGVKVGLGVDGSASNDSGNLLSEARMALMLARVSSEKADALSPIQALKLATRGGAEVLGRDDVGLIRPGMCADIVGWRLDAPAFAGTLHSKASVLSALVLGNGGDLKADYVMVNGRPVVKNGQLAGSCDMSRITQEHTLAALALAERAIKADAVKED